MRLRYALLRLTVLISVLAACAANLCVRAAFANDKDKQLKAQAEALLAKSRDLSNIEAPGSPAFALDAKIHYQIGAQSADGQGQIIYLAPDHYREVYTAPNYSYVEIVRDGYRYLARTNDEMPLLIYELKQTIGHTLTAGLTQKEKIKEVEVSQVGDQPLTCVTFNDKSLFRRCITSDGDVAMMERHAPAGDILGERYEFSNFATFGAKRFPQKIVFRGGDGHTIEISVVDIMLVVKDPAADAFNVPANAMKEAWCSEPKMAQLSTSPFSVTGIDIAPVMAFAGTQPSLYWVIGPNGHARSVTLIHSSKPISQKDLQNLVRDATFGSLRCGKDGIEYQLETGPIG